MSKIRAHFYSEKKERNKEKKQINESQNNFPFHGPINKYIFYTNFIKNEWNDETFTPCVPLSTEFSSHRFHLFHKLIHYYS